MSRLSESSDDSPGPGSPTWPKAHWPSHWPASTSSDTPSFSNQSHDRRVKSFSDESDESDEPPRKKFPVQREATSSRSNSYVPSSSPSPSGSPTKELPPKVEMSEERKQLIIRLDNFFKARYTEKDAGYEREISTPERPPPILPEFQGRSYRSNRQDNRRYNR